MNYIDDLKIKKEIFPLFDYTLNDITKSNLLDTFNSPLKDINTIDLNQNIIKGFIQNLENVKEYNYSKLYFHQVYDYLNQTSFIELEVTKIDLVLSSRARIKLQSILIPILTIFDKIYHLYLTKLDLNAFPNIYQNEIKQMIDFISHFRKDQYKSPRLDKVSDLISLSNKINTQRFEFRAFFKTLIQSEIYLSLAKGIKNNNFVFPVLDSPTIKFENLYHPLLKNPVENDVTIDKNVILLTGPNMSGKSTFLKSIFLSVYLGHLGLAVPAKSAKFPFFDYFSISINHNDDLINGYSHFMNEILSLKKSLTEHQQGKKCFVIFDELFKGTNIEDALAISTRTIRSLTKFNHSYFFISTHLHLLNELDVIKKNKTANFYIESKIVENQPIFTYKLKEGWSELKIGQILFNNEGLNELLA